MRAIAVAVLALVAVAAVGGVAWYALQEPAPPAGPAGGSRAPVPRRGTPAVPPVGTNGTGNALDGNGAGGSPDGNGSVAHVPSPPVVRGKEPPIPEPSAEPVPGAGAHFHFPAWEDVVGSVDWTHVGIASRKAHLAFRDTWKKLDHGAELGAVLHQTIMGMQNVASLVNPIVDRAMGITPGRPMRPPSGLPFTQPVFESNAIAATLDAWGRPLTREQETAVKALFDARLEEWRIADGEGTASPWHYDGFVAFTKSRAELQTKLEAILTQEQRDALWDPETKGRVRLDLFCLATLWHDQIMIIPLREGEDPAGALAGRLRGEMTIDRSVGPEFEAAVAAWVKSAPAAWKQGLKGPVSRNGYPTEAELLAGVEAMAVFVRTVHVKGWRKHDLDPFLPPFRRVFLFSRTLY